MEKSGGKMGLVHARNTCVHSGIDRARGQSFRTANLARMHRLLRFVAVDLDAARPHTDMKASEIAHLAQPDAWAFLKRWEHGQKRRC